MTLSLMSYSQQVEAALSPLHPPHLCQLLGELSRDFVGSVQHDLRVFHPFAGLAERLFRMINVLPRERPATTHACDWRSVLRCSNRRNHSGSQKLGLFSSEWPGHMFGGLLRDDDPFFDVFLAAGERRKEPTGPPQGACLHRASRVVKPPDLWAVRCRQRLRRTVWQVSDYDRRLEGGQRFN